MMADAVEARSRSLKEYTENNVYAMVDDMIEQQINEGQFSDTPLSFKDVEDIRQVFKERLLAINHHRIKYPTINK
jgi:membrane-associated HD superfamily phosphohydrolase